VLLAEDERINQLYMLHLLQGAGHEVAVANDGEEVLRLLREQAFDLVLMDVQMPRLNGLEAAKRIRNDGEFATAASIPIIALSAHSSAKDLESFLSTGMNESLTKPIDEAALLELIKTYEENDDS
jgi:CheY-like chemotaxis protein